MSDILLAVDCSLRRTGIAVASERGGELKILSELNEDVGRKQATELPRLAEKAIKDSGVKTGEITHVAVTNGPGYFTGIRIGMSWSAAYAFGIGAKVVPVGTLEALMYGSDEGPSIFLVYAGRNSVYAISSGFPSNLTAREYDTGYIEEWASAYENLDFRVFLDNPEKITISLPHARVITPKISNVVKIGWSKRNDHSISPFELRANWCRSPV